MTPRERAAFNAGVEDTREVRQQAASTHGSGTYSRSAGTRSLSFSCS